MTKKKMLVTTNCCDFVQHEPFWYLNSVKCGVSGANIA